jgi:hypothetical protein
MAGVAGVVGSGLMAREEAVRPRIAMMMFLLKCIIIFMKQTSRIHLEPLGVGYDSL